VKGGFDVPAAFVINAGGFQRFMRESGLVARTNRSPGLETRGNLRDQPAHLHEIALGATVPMDLQDEVLAAYADLSKRSVPAVAVRSSATSEDSALSSFAGMFDTYLNLAAPEAVIDAVQRCYASMWSEQVLGYHARRGSESTGAMAIVVMEMISAETSGVVFTAHPVTGSREQLVINAAWGLGDAIVSGAVIPDSFVFAKDTLELLEQETSTKTIGVFPSIQGMGVVESEQSAEKATTASLDEVTAREVARVASNIERYFGSPQDIEFAVASGRLYILQSRPITTL
jgi:pyruvate,water dikinase